MFCKELAQQTLMRSCCGIAQRLDAITAEEVPNGRARLGGKYSTADGQTSAPLTEGTAGLVAEKDDLVITECIMALPADVERWSEPQLSHDPPCARQRGGERLVRGSGGEGIQRLGHGVEKPGVRRVPAKAKRELSDGRCASEAPHILAQ